MEHLPGESKIGVFGGNSNWRGSVWMAVNVMFIGPLRRFYLYYGDNFTIEYPIGSGNRINRFEVAREFTMSRGSPRIRFNFARKKECDSDTSKRVVTK